MSCSYQFFRFSHDLFLKKSDQPSHLGCELVAGVFESEGDRLLSLLLLELLPPSPPVLLPVQEEANTWAWFAYWAVLLKKTIVHCINHLPSYLVECRLYEPSETSGPTNGDRSSSLRVATSPSCKRFLKNISAFMSESEPRGWLYLPSPTGKPPEASSRCGVGGSGVEALSDPERIHFPIFSHISSIDAKSIKSVICCKYALFERILMKRTTQKL